MSSLFSYRQLRHKSLARWRSVGWALSVVVHLALVASLFVLPAVMAGEREPISYVAVQVIPVQALGVPDAPPAKEKRRPEPEPEVAKPEPQEPEPAKPKPEPKQPAPSSDRPALPSPDSGGQKAEEPTSRPPSPPQATAGSAEGSATSTLAFGSTQVTGLDNPDFVYGYYLNQMLGMIHSHWQRPPADVGVEVIVSFRIAKNGSISELRVRETSGNGTYDLAALRAVQSAAPFPPLPQAYRHSSLGVNLRVQ